MLKLVFAILLLSIAATAHAQIDSVSEALGILDDFHKESYSWIKESSLSKGADRFGKSSIEEKEKAKKELRSLGVAQSPGPERARSIYKVVDSYTGTLISSVKDVAGPSPEEQKAAAEVIRKMTALKESSLKGLEETLRREAPKRKKQKSVPSIGPSPFVNSPDEAEGIWFR